MERSLLDDLGEEVTGIAAPVSICMALTVALVRLLNADGGSNSTSVRLATIYYDEQVGEMRRSLAAARGGRATLGAKFRRRSKCGGLYIALSRRSRRASQPPRPRPAATGGRLDGPEAERLGHQRAHLRRHHRGFDLCARAALQVRGAPGRGGGGAALSLGRGLLTRRSGLLLWIIAR
jgi:hypothetical protein